MPFDFEMDSISPVESSGGITPTGTISITEDGTYDVTNYASADVSVAGGGSKYGATVNSLLGDVNADGVLQQPTEQSDLVFTGVKGVIDNVFYYKFARAGVKSVSFPALTTVSGSSGCSYMFYDCTALTSASFPALTTVSGRNGCGYMFYNCTALTSASFPALTTVSGSSGCSNMFAYCIVTSITFPALTTVSGSNGCSYMFSLCTALKTASFPVLTTVSGSNGCSYMFYGCKALKTASFPALTTVSGSNGCGYMFYNCTALTDVYFPSLKTTSFGTYKNQFNSMMSISGSITTHTLHFPSNLESTISTLTGYPLFGGTSGYVVCAFDLPATE